jgi:hypothetical protein
MTAEKTGATKSNVEGSEPSAVLSSSWPKHSFAVRAVLSILATLVVGASVVALWRLMQLATAGPRAGLVAAVRERRFFEARLTGGFKYGDLISPKRGGLSAIAHTGDGSPTSGGSPDPRTPATRSATGPAAEDWEVLSAAAKIKKDIGTPKNGEERSTLASAHLVLGEMDEAVRLFERALRDPENADGRNAKLRSDLAAAYLTRAVNENRADDYPRGLENVAHAVEIDPTLREALYNKALALEFLYLSNQAIKAWDAFIANEPDGGWLDEAKKRRDALVHRPKPDFGKLELDIKGALENGTDEELTVAVRAAVGIARDVFEMELLRDIGNREHAALRLASAFTRVSGDPYMEDLLEGERAAMRYRAHTFADVRRSYDQGEPLPARATAVGGADRPLALWSGLYGAIRLYQADVSLATPILEQIASRSERYPLLQGRSLWVVGLGRLALGDYSGTIEAYTRARDLLRRVGHQDWSTFMESQLAEVQSYLGDTDAAYTHRIASFQRVPGMRDQIRRIVALLSAADFATEDGFPRLALALADEIVSTPAQIPAGRYHRASVNRMRAQAFTALRQEDEYKLALAEARRQIETIVNPAEKLREASEMDIVEAEVAPTDAGPEAERSLALLDRGLHALAKRGVRQREPRLRLNRAQTLASLGRSPEAAVDVEQGLRVFEAPRSLSEQLRLDFADRSWGLYAELLARKAREGATSLELLEVAERSYRLAYTGATVEKPDLASAILSESRGRLVLAYFLGPRDVFGWIIESGAVRHAIWPRTAASDDWIEQYSVAIGEGREKDADEIGRRLVATFLDPLNSNLRAASEIIVIPHGALYQLPFEALFLQQGLVRRGVRVMEAPVLMQTQSRARRAHNPATSGYLIVADPETHDFPRLPGARKEGRSLLSASPNSTLLEGQRGTVSAVRTLLPRFRHLYFGTHAFFNPRRPTLSSILLTDGRLYAQEIAASDLAGVDTVTLATCDAARSARSTSAGFSIARAFLLAGAREVVASLIPVSDAPDATAAATATIHFRAFALGEGI